MKSVFIHCTNPAHTLPNINKHTEGLKKAFVAMKECFHSVETLKYADVVFPAAFWCEAESVYGCTERRYALLKSC